jgi:hypothetical protein
MKAIVHFLSLHLFLRRRRISSVVNDIRHGALHALGKNLLDLLGHNRVLAVVQCVRLAGRLAGCAAGGVDLLSTYGQHVFMFTNSDEC